MDASQTPLILPAPKRVLVVDDAVVNRLIARKLLEHLGHTTVEAKSGSEALQHLTFGSFDLVLLDLYMPGMDGFAVIEAIRGGRAGHCGVPLVALTADESSRDRCYSLGIDGWALKPLRLATLSRIIMELFLQRVADTKQRLTGVR